MDDVAVT